MVCATDLGFMSTSLNNVTPIHYMRGNSPNLLWEIHQGPEDNVAYHCGALISELSQYSGEDEVLFPPLTMLRVMERKGDAPDDLHNPLEADWQTADLVSESGKHYKRVSVIPAFI